MARDRQRAKQRRARRAAQQGGAKPAQPPRDDFQGPLGQVGEQDVVEAAIAAGAGGEVVDGATTDAIGGAEHPEELSDAEFEQLEDRVDEVEEVFEDGDHAEVDALEHELEEESKAAVPAKAAVAGAPTRRGPARFVAFLRASWAELQRVQWPDRRQVGQATAVVLGFVVVAGIYLGLADVLANEIVDWII